MTKRHWDFYLCQVDGELASIFLDLSLLDRAPVAALPHSAYIRLQLRAPGADGLPGPEEATFLGELEKQLDARLCASRGTLLVGSVTSAGCRDYYYYLKDGADWPERVAAAMQSAGDYQYDCGSRWEPDWTTYADFLFPSDIELQGMGNRSICVSLQEKGDPLTEPREILHWISLPSDVARQSYIDWAVALGFSVREVSANAGDLPFGLCLSRIDLPSFAAIDDVTLPLYEKAIELSADYEGWETHAVQATGES